MNFYKPYSTIIFGKFEYSDGGYINQNRIHVSYPMKWIVLDIDKKNHKMLLLSKKIVFVEGFADCPLIGRGYKTSWEKSFVRHWLNSEYFLKKAFSEKEQSLISTTIISPEKYLHKRTFDRIFLLSQKEYEKYFINYSDEAYWDYVDELDQNNIQISNEKLPWWLRTISDNDDSMVACVFSDSISYADSNNSYGIRPAMWINY